jgi:hypothetical protein
VYLWTWASPIRTHHESICPISMYPVEEGSRVWRIFYIFHSTLGIFFHENNNKECRASRQSNTFVVSGFFDLEDFYVNFEVTNIYEYFMRMFFNSYEWFFFLLSQWSYNPRIIWFPKQNLYIHACIKTNKPRDPSIYWAIWLLASAVALL